MAGDPRRRQVTHFRIAEAWTEAFHRGMTTKDRRGILTASGGQQETSTVVNKVEDGEAHLQQLQEDVIMTQLIMETRKILYPMNAGSERKAVDEDEHRQPLILEITTSPMISDGGKMGCINRNAVSVGDPMGA